MQDPPLQTTWPSTATTGSAAPFTGIAMVPLVPAGAVTLIANSPAPLCAAHAIRTAPCGVGACPSAQAGSPGWGCTVQVA